MSSIASANFPAPQPLSVVLVPPPSPLSAIAGANFPAPQPLSVVLVPGSQVRLATVIGTAPVPLLVPPTYDVQIVQVIHRRGANFFDRNDPTGQATVVVVASAGGGTTTPTTPTPPAPPPPLTEVCANLVPGGTVFTDGHGNPFAAAPPNAGLRISFFGLVFVPIFGFVNGVQLQAEPPWDSFSGITPLGIPPGTSSTSYSIGCPSNASTNTFQLRFRILGGQFCVRRNSLTTSNCDAQGN